MRAKQSEIEITDEMIRAGVEVLSAYLEGPIGVPLDALAEEVFLAMALNGADRHHGADSAGISHWQQCYEDLWKLKVAFEKERNR